MSKSAISRDLAQSTVTLAHCAYARCDARAVSSPCFLYSFMMIILGLELCILLVRVCTRDCTPAIIADSAE